MNNLYKLGALFLCMFSSAFPVTTHGAQIVSMGTLISCCNGVDISGDGQIAVGVFQPSTPVYWTPTQGLVTVPGRTGAVFIGISRDGSAMIGSGTSGNFYYSATTGFVGLPNTSGQTLALNLVAQGVSDDGSVITGQQNVPGSGTSALIWDTVGNPTLISEGSGFDISGDGTVVVGRGSVGGTQQATRWELNSLLGGWDQTGLTTGIGGGEAHAVSQDGSIVFGVAGGNAFRWIEGVGTEDISGTSSYTNIWAVTANGAIAAGTADGKAAIWDESNGWRTIESLLLAAGVVSNDLANLDIASAISNDGRYLVANVNPGSTGTGFWIDLGTPLTTVPVPATAWLFSSGLLGLIGIARKRKSI